MIEIAKGSKPKQIEFVPQTFKKSSKKRLIRYQKTKKALQKLQDLKIVNYYLN